MELLPKDSIEREKDILWFFDAAIILKAMNGAFEVLAALLILLIPPSLIVSVVEFITGGELSQDPTDPIASFLQSAAAAFAVHSHYFLAAYLFIHGAVKVILVIGIFKGKKIAYQLFMIAIVLFGTYETYRGFARGELLLQALAVFDFAVFLLTSYEYRRRYQVSD